MFTNSQKRGISLSVMVNVLEVIEEKITKLLEKSNVNHKFVVFSAYCTISCVLSLQRCEGFLLDIEGLRQVCDPN